MARKDARLSAPALTAGLTCFGCIFVIMDNLSTHKTPAVLQWCRRNQVLPVFTATNASGLNRVECHLTAAHYFVIKNSDPEDHRDVGQRMPEYLRWRNRNTDNARLVKPKAQCQLFDRALHSSARSALDPSLTRVRRGGTSTICDW